MYEKISFSRILYPSIPTNDLITILPSLIGSLIIDIFWIFFTYQFDLSEHLERFWTIVSGVGSSHNVSPFVQPQTVLSPFCAYSHTSSFSKYLPLEQQPPMTSSVLHRLSTSGRWPCTLSKLTKSPAIPSLNSTTSSGSSCSSSSSATMYRAI